MKAYTDLEQSKKLAKILPNETSDMYYWCGDENDIRFGGFAEYDIPCWSLAALISILTSNCNRQTIDITRGGWLNDGKEFTKNFFISYEDSEDNDFTLNNKELIDTCVEMIEVLHEQKIL